MEFLPSPSKNNMFSFGSEAQTSKHVKSSHRVIKTRDSLNVFSTKYHVTLIYRVIQSLVGCVTCIEALIMVIYVGVFFTRLVSIFI